MAITYTWTVYGLDCLPETPEGDDYVVTAHWRLVGVDGEYTGVVDARTSFPVVQGEAFIPYADLTQDIVLGWCYEHGVDQNAMEGAVAGQIAAAKEPQPVSEPLPWGV